MTAISAFNVCRRHLTIPIPVGSLVGGTDIYHAVTQIFAQTPVTAIRKSAVVSEGPCLGLGFRAGFSGTAW